MISHNHLFVMDSLEKLNKKLDSSLRMAFALCERGHNIYITTPKDISWSMNDGVASLSSQPLHFDKENFDSLQTGAAKQVLLSDFDAIYMRKDPPFDMDYITCTWMLDTARQNTRIYNAPTALRSFNEKLLGFHFPEFSNPGLVSTKPKELLQFIQEGCNGDAIIKPLDLFGGKGIERLNVEELGIERVEKLLKEHTDNGVNYRLVQPFETKIFEGELRIFTFMGKIIASSKKIPAAGNYLANTSAGATVQNVDLTAEMSQKITTLSKKLIKMGVFMVGYDVIGDLVSEINITSPRMLLADSSDLSKYHVMAELIENDIANFSNTLKTQL